MFYNQLETFRASISAMADAAHDDDSMRDAIIQMLADAKLIEQPRKWERPGPCPASIAAGELAVFDNWRVGGGAKKKGCPYRWAARLKVWEKGGKIDWNKPTFVGTATLFDHREVIKKAESLVKPKLLEPISRDFRDAIVEEFAPLMKDVGFMGGPLYTKQARRGTYYHDMQVVLMDAAELRSGKLRVATLILGASRVDIAGFSACDPSGAPLTGGCVAVARYVDPEDAELSAKLARWSTGGLIE